MDIYHLEMTLINGKKQALETYRGKVVLVVNVASQCGFTPQYDGLEKLYQEYKDRGLVVLGFPCNQFGSQEPGDEASIQNFCKVNYGVTFPLSKKIDVNGPDADPIYQYLKNEQKGILGTEAIKWNFTKFLVGRDGSVVKRFPPQTKPETMKPEIESLL